MNLILAEKFLLPTKTLVEQDNTVSKILVNATGTNYIPGDVRVFDLGGNGSGLLANFSVDAIGAIER